MSCLLILSLIFGKLLVMQFSSTSSYFLFLRVNYFPSSVFSNIISLYYSPRVQEPCFTPIQSDQRTCKGKVIQLHAMEALGVRGGIAPTHY
jgi:hypothetical protein